MLRNPNFYQSTRAQAPNYVQAAMIDEQADQQAKAQMTNDLMAAAMLYNDAMGERTPIADMLFKKKAPQAVKTFNMAGGLSKAPTTGTTYNMAGGVNTASNTAQGAQTAQNASQGSQQAAGGAASAGPWGALAAAIIANESDAYGDEDNNYRDFEIDDWLRAGHAVEDVKRFNVGGNLAKAYGGKKNGKFANMFNDSMQGSLDPITGVQNWRDGKGFVGKALHSDTNKRILDPLNLARYV